MTTEPINDREGVMLARLRHRCWQSFVFTVIMLVVAVLCRPFDTVNLLALVLAACGGVAAFAYGVAWAMLI